MTRKKCLLVFTGVVCLLVMAQLACQIPSKVHGGGTVSSATGAGQAMLSLHGGCDLDTNEVSGFLVYNDGPAGVGFRADIDFEPDDNCDFPVPGDWLATGPYTPHGQGEPGVFWLGLFGEDHPNYPDDERCAACSSCWRLWLEGGAFDGYENWACELEHGQIKTWEQPSEP